MSNHHPRPLVSVATPFFNTAEYLEACIESVLNQTYSNWEYILLDNCSDDGSSDIARRYADREPRIKLLRTKSHLSQVQNYNEASKHISEASVYTKFVEADNWIFDNCLTLMVELAERHATVGIVSSYNITERTVRFGGLHCAEEVVEGRELARRHLLEGLYIFGSPTTVLVRSDIVRSRSPFFSEDNPYAEDLRAMYDILKEHDFGFVHQVTTFVRTDNESILSHRKEFDGQALDRFIITRLYGPTFLSAAESAQASATVRTNYYQILAKGLMLGKGRAFWDFHREGITAAGAEFQPLYLVWQGLREIARLVLNPQNSLKQAFSMIRRKLERTRQPRPNRPEKKIDGVVR